MEEQPACWAAPPADQPCSRPTNLTDHPLHCDCSPLSPKTMHPFPYCRVPSPLPLPHAHCFSPTGRSRCGTQSLCFASQLPLVFKPFSIHTLFTPPSSLPAPPWPIHVTHACGQWCAAVLHLSCLAVMSATHVMLSSCGLWRGKGGKQSRAKGGAVGELAAVRGKMKKGGAGECRPRDEVGTREGAAAKAQEACSRLHRRPGVADAARRSPQVHMGGQLRGQVSCAAIGTVDLQFRGSNGVEVVGISMQRNWAARPSSPGHTKSRTPSASQPASSCFGGL